MDKNKKKNRIVALITCFTIIFNFFSSMCISCAYTVHTIDSSIDAIFDKAYELAPNGTNEILVGRNDTRSESRENGPLTPDVANGHNGGLIQTNEIYRICFLSYAKWIIQD